MSFPNFWRNVGKVFAHIGVGAIEAARWASDHPEVEAIVETTLKVPPGVAQGINAGIAAAGNIPPPSTK